MSPLVEFRSRGGETFAYRLYPTLSENLLILIHGIGGDSRYLKLAARHVAAAGVATVVTPDLRGHGERPHGPLASVAKASQLEEDMEELLVHLRQSLPARHLAWGGHSLGGGLALRMGLAGGSFPPAGILALAPFLPPETRVSRSDFGGWIRREGSRLHVNMPAVFRTGSEVLEYETGFFAAALPPADVLQRLPAATKLRVVVGDRDAVFDAGATAAWAAAREGAGVRRVAADHLGVVAVPPALAALVTSARELF